MTLSPEERSEIRDYFVQRFSIEELKDLCFDVGISHEEIAHDVVKPTFARELVSYGERAGQLDYLLRKAIEKRHDIRALQALAKVETSKERQKVEIVLPIELLNVTHEQFKQMIAQSLNGITPDQIQIIGVARGSMRILISVPDSIDIKAFQERLQQMSFGEPPVSSITSFDKLDAESQEIWRRVIKQKPFAETTETLQPALNWIDMLQEYQQSSALQNGDADQFTDFARDEIRKVEARMREIMSRFTKARGVLIALMGIVLAAVLGAYFELIPRSVICRIFPNAPLICPHNPEITVQVSDKTNGTMLMGARVVFVYQGGVLVEPTDSSGVATLKLPSDANSSRLIVEFSNYEIEERQITASAVADVIQVKLAQRQGKQAHVIFRVVDNKNRRPVAGAAVTVFTNGNVFNESTDQNGLAKFSLEFLTNGLLDAKINVNTKSYEIVDQIVTLTPNKVQDVRLNPDNKTIVLSDVDVTGGVQKESTTISAQSSSACPKSIAFGQLVTDTISSAAEIHIYCFQANTNDAIIVRIVSVSGSFCPRIRLLGPDRKEMSNQRTYPGCISGEVQITLSESGNHKILIDNDGSTQTGEYGLSIQKIP